MVRAVASVFGIAFLAVGVLGFILNPTGGELLGIFAVNVAHNLVHVAFGVLGIAAAYAGWSRLYLQGVGVSTYCCVFWASFRACMSARTCCLG